MQVQSLLSVGRVIARILIATIRVLIAIMDAVQNTRMGAVFLVVGDMGVTSALTSARIVRDMHAGFTLHMIWTQFIAMFVRKKILKCWNLTPMRSTRVQGPSNQDDGTISEESGVVASVATKIARRLLLGIHVVIVQNLPVMITSTSVILSVAEKMVVINVLTSACNVRNMYA